MNELFSLQNPGIVVLLVLCALAVLWGIVAFAKKQAATRTIHPGMSDETFAAIVGAAVASTQSIHPGLSREAFIALITAAATEALDGMSVSVVKFKPLSTMDWTWAVQGRVSLHSHKI